MPVYPITFSIHSSKITNYIPNKTKLLSDIIPGKPYSFKNENDYYNEYKQSIFAVTCKKSGWDCMRHYEILACGCIPIFINLNECPDSIMTHFPKTLIYKTEELYNSLQKTSLEEAGKKTRQLAEELIIYTQSFLTNVSMAEYVLNKSGISWSPFSSRPNNHPDHRLNHSPYPKILFLSGSLSPDYMRCQILTGLKELFQSNCHDFPRINHIYKDYDGDFNSFHGKGFSYSLLLDKSFHNYEYDATLFDDINNHVYDIVIYGSIHRGMPFWNVIKQIYKPDELIFICGEDTHSCVYETMLNENPNYNLFVRELEKENPITISPPIVIYSNH